MQLLEQAHMDSFFSQAEKAQQSFEQQREFWSYGSHSAQHESGGPAPHRYMPYKKDTDKQKTTDSFQENKKPILCLHLSWFDIPLLLFSFILHINLIILAFFPAV